MGAADFDYGRRALIPIMKRLFPQDPVIQGFTLALVSVLQACAGNGDEKKQELAPEYAVTITGKSGETLEGKLTVSREAPGQGTFQVLSTSTEPKSIASILSRKLEQGKGEVTVGQDKGEVIVSFLPHVEDNGVTLSGKFVGEKLTGSVTQDDLRGIHTLGQFVAVPKKN